MKYRAYTSRIGYLTGNEKDFMYFGRYSSKYIARKIAKFFAVIRDKATFGEWDGVKFGVENE